MKAIEEYSLEELKAQLKKKENAQKAEQAKKSVYIKTKEILMLQMLL